MRSTLIPPPTYNRSSRFRICPLFTFIAIPPIVIVISVAIVAITGGAGVTLGVNHQTPAVRSGPVVQWVSIRTFVITSIVFAITIPSLVVKTTAVGFVGD